MKKEIGDIFGKYSDEINNNHFDRAILDLYIQYGEIGLLNSKKCLRGRSPFCKTITRQLKE